MATAQMPTEEEVFQMAESLQEHFLKEHRDDPQMDPRDIGRIQRSLPYVAKFVRHNRGQFDNAYNHMIECLKWRKSFGISDIKLEDIDESLWKLGMAYNHGLDRGGNQIVILNIRLHKKDSKKALMLRRWIAFCYETLQRLHPDKKMCVIFDMEGAGLSNMDMNLIRFVVNCFKIYFPNLLAWLLVYNMPWILQAAWKIVQSWLDESAVNKVKFVTRESIMEYVDQENLLVKFGGNDPWTYDFEAESERMRQEVTRLEQLLEEDTHASVNPPESETGAFEGGEEEEEEGEGGSREDEEGEGEGEEEEEEEGEGVERAVEPTGKKVRFHSNLPPTRQSRFGPEDEDSRGSPRSPNHHKLVGGGSSTTRKRKQQVEKLMSLQGSPGKRSQRSPDQSLDLSDVTVTTSLPVGKAKPSSRRRASEPVRLTGFSDITIDPSHELVFSGTVDSDILCTLTLTNISQHMVAYKVKTTAPLRYKVRPNLALIDPKSKAVVQVLLLPGGASVPISQDKFLVQSYTFNSSTPLPDQTQLVAFWKSLSEKSIREHRMRCRWTNGQPSVKVLHSEQSNPPVDTAQASHMEPRPTPEGAKVPAQSPSPANRELQTLKAKVNLLIDGNAELTQKIERLQTSNYVVVVLLVLIVILTCFL